jgi:hypothetical protein
VLATYERAKWPNGRIERGLDFDFEFYFSTGSTPGILGRAHGDGEQKLDYYEHVILERKPCVEGKSRASREGG